MDPRVTATLLGATLDLLSEGGMDSINADTIARRAGSGKAALYRRWSSVPSLVVHAVGSCSLVPSVPGTGVLRDDLARLLEPLTLPLDQRERAVAALLGRANHSDDLRSAVESAVLAPLSAALDQILVSRSSSHGEVPEGRQRQLDLVVRSLWWHRYAGFAQVMAAAEVAELVDRVLLPLTSVR